MNPRFRIGLLALATLACAACLRINVQGTPDVRALERLPGEMSRAIRGAMPAVRFSCIASSGLAWMSL